MNIPKYLIELRKELERKGYRDTTVRNYLSSVEKFLFKYSGSVKEPEKITSAEIKEYLGQFKKHNTQRSNHSAIKCLYKYVIHQPNKFKYIEYCKRSRKLPIVLSKQEIQSIFNRCSNLKHKAILSLMYSTGIRVSEVINLKITDVDSDRMIINIRDAKGGKDRQVMLPEKLLILLREYYKEYRPNVYLFNGQNSQQYSTTSIAQFLKEYSKHLNKRVYPHLLRHTSFTHLVEAGTDINLVQRLAGHQSVKTTNLYIQTSHTLISQINSPINAISI